LPALGASPERLALVKNADLLDMARMGKASTPMDLMTYRPEDEIPSIFLLKEDRRLTILTVFNWTEGARSHTFNLADLGLPEGDNYQASDILDSSKSVDLAGDRLTLDGQPSHTVRVIKIIDTSVAAAPPSVTAQVPSSAQTGAAVKFSAAVNAEGVPAITYRWDFGDGNSEEGALVNHAFTAAASYIVRLKVEGADGVASEQTFPVTVSGEMKADFDLPNNRRYVEKDK